MKPLNIFVFTVVAALVASWSVFAQPPGKGKGYGKGNPGHGRMAEDFRGVIHSLFAEHEKIERSVELTGKGYRARTTSKDPEVAALLQKHVGQMESRLEGGMGVRNWDPAFAELREHYDDLEVTLEKIEGGIVATVSGKTPEAIAVARNHARIVSGFVEKGSEQMHATHPAVTANHSENDAEVAAAGKAGGCEKCQGGKKQGKAGSSELCSCGGSQNCGKGGACRMNDEISRSN